MQAHMDHMEEMLLKGTETEALLLLPVELLVADTNLHGNGKSGAGGYMHNNLKYIATYTTFHAKKVLYAIQSMQMPPDQHNPFNTTKTFFVTCGSNLNVLLLMALAFHSIKQVPHVDFEAADIGRCVVFVVLLSNYGSAKAHTDPYIHNL